MFLFVQARTNLQNLSFFDNLKNMIESSPDLVYLHSEKTLVFSDLPFKFTKKNIIIWMQGHRAYPSQKVIDEALTENVWENFGSSRKVKTF